MTYKCVLVGCGKRAAGHVDAYQHVTRGNIVALCDQIEENVQSLGERFGIAARYTDLEQMLRKEKPDVLHVVTPPSIRLDILTIASEYTVPAVILEKPIATQGEDYRELCEFNASTKIKICVNHQTHFYPRRLELGQYIREGHIGEMRFLDASARMNLAYQGTHVLQLISAFNDGARPTSVLGQVAGAEGLEGSNGHYAPDQCLGAIAYEDGTRAQFQCGTNAPSVGEDKINRHIRIAIYGTRGFVHWTMKWWEKTGLDGSIVREKRDYRDVDILGQAGLTNALFDWMEDESKVHPASLEASLTQFNVILGIYASALRHESIALPFDPEPQLIDALRARLGEN